MQQQDQNQQQEEQIRTLTEHLRVSRKEVDSLKATADDNSTHMEMLLELHAGLFKQNKQLLEQSKAEKKVRDDENAELKRAIKTIRDALPPPDDMVDHTSPAVERTTVDITSDSEVDESEAYDSHFFKPLDSAFLSAARRMDDMMQRRQVERLSSASGLKKRPAQPSEHPFATKKSYRPE